MYDMKRFNRGTAIEKVLWRRVETRTPEARIVVAVLRQAIVDLHTAKYRMDAVCFFARGYFQDLCHYVGLEPEFVNDVARDAKKMITLKLGALNETPTKH